jgi:hypothetical protein
MRVEHRLDPFAAALSTIDLWPVALLGFLARGGVLLFLLPIIVIPSPIDVANLFGPVVTAAALGGPNPALVELAILATVATAVIVCIGFLLGATADVAVSAASAGLLGSRAVTARRAFVGRAFAVRLLAHVPTAIVLAGSVPAIVNAVYQELISPFDLATPLVVRILRDVPALLAVVAAIWLLGEAVGGLATRLVVVEDRGVVGALRGAVARLVLSPVRSIVAFVVGDLTVVVLVSPALAASAFVWRAVAFDLRLGDDPLRILVGTLALVGLWLGGLVLAAFGVALRALLWSRVALRS